MRSETSCIVFLYSNALNTGSPTGGSIRSYLCHHKPESMKTYNYPPQVSNTDLAYNLLALKADPLQVYPRNIKKYGSTFYLHLPRFKYEIIVTQDPGLVEHVLQKNQRNYSKSPLQ